MVKGPGKYITLGDKVLKWDGNRVYNVLRNKKHIVSISAYKVPYIPEKVKARKFAGTIDKKTRIHLSKLDRTIMFKADTVAAKKKEVELAKWDSYDVRFMASKSQNGVSDEFIEKEIDKNEKHSFKNCEPSYYRRSNNTELNSCVTAEISTKGRQGFYYIANLMLDAEADNICHSISGAEQIYIVEHYFKSLVPGRLVGSLYDGAHNYMNETCKEINRLYTNGKLTKELVNSLLRFNTSGYDRLSSLTVAKTGLTYYEKFGYMAGVTNMKDSAGPALMEFSYAGCFKTFLGKIESRLDILDLKLADILKEHVKKPNTLKKGDRGAMSSNNMYGGGASKKTKKIKPGPDTEKPSEVVKPKYSKRVVNALATRLPSIKYLLAKLRPDTKFEFVYVQDLYRYMSGEYTQNFFCKENKHMSLEHALLLYAIVTTNISNLLTNILFSLVEEARFNCVKFARVERTRDHDFILEQHARLPAVKKEYLGGIIGDELDEKGDKLDEKEDNKLVGGAKKAIVGLTCEEREAIRSRVDKIVARIALIK